MYYAIKGKKLENKNFKKNLNLINEKTGKYNILALLLSDDNAIKIIKIGEGRNTRYIRNI